MITVEPTHLVSNNSSEQSQVKKEQFSLIKPSTHYLRMVGVCIAVMLVSYVILRVFIPLTPSLFTFITLKREKITVNELPYSPEAFMNRMAQRDPNLPSDIFALDAQDYVRELPSTISDIYWLKKIFITDNPLERLPNSIGSLANLELLAVQNGKLTSLPLTIGSLHALKTLSLPGNNLKNVPDTIGDLTNLRGLNLSYNRLESLPSTLENLSHLEVLDLTGNRLRTIPMLPPHLVTLFIGGNPIPVAALESIARALFPLQVYY